MINWFLRLSEEIKKFVMRPTKMSNNGISLLKEFEGFSAKPYLDSAGIPTIGYGATYYPGGKRVKMSDPPISESEATLMLADMIVPYETAVRGFVTSKINQNQFDALVSFAYNIGTSAFKSSTLLKKVNEKPNQLTIAHEFLKWNKATVNGKKIEIRGLTNRRRKESELYFSL